MWKYFRLVPEWFAGLFTHPEPEGSGHDPRRRFYNVAHRGAPCFEVENTLRSFQRAVDVDGANGIEFDLCMTSDGAIVVWHDWEPDGDICRLRTSGMEPDVKYCPRLPDDMTLVRPIHELTLQEFLGGYGYAEKGAGGERVDAAIPMLDEVIRWAVTRETLDIIFFDIKIPECHAGLAPRMMEGIEKVLASYSPRFTIVFETLYENVLAAMKEHTRGDHEYTLDVEPAIGIVLDPASFGAMSRAIRHGNGYATAERPRQTTLAPWSTYRRIIEHDLVLRDAPAPSGGGRRRLIGFTVNDEEEMGTLVRMGIDGLQTDRADLLTKVLANEGIVLDGAGSPPVGGGSPSGRRDGSHAVSSGSESVSARAPLM